MYVTRVDTKRAARSVSNGRSERFQDRWVRVCRRLRLRRSPRHSKTAHTTSWRWLPRWVPVCSRYRSCPRLSTSPSRKPSVSEFGALNPCRNRFREITRRLCSGRDGFLVWKTECTSARRAFKRGASPLFTSCNFARYFSATRRAVILESRVRWLVMVMEYVCYFSARQSFGRLAGDDRLRSL